MFQGPIYKLLFDDEIIKQCIQLDSWTALSCGSPIIFQISLFLFSLYLFCCNKPFQLHSSPPSKFNLLTMFPRRLHSLTLLCNAATAYFARFWVWSTFSFCLSYVENHNFQTLRYPTMVEASGFTPIPLLFTKSSTGHWMDVIWTDFLIGCLVLTNIKFKLKKSSSHNLSSIVLSLCFGGKLSFYSAWHTVLFIETIRTSSCFLHATW